MEKKFDRSSFMEVLWKLMLPIVLQNLLSAVVSTADVLMLTHVSQTALSASSLAGQYHRPGIRRSDHTGSE